MKVKTSKKMSRGQGMVEYLILVALLAIATISAAQYFGQEVRQTLAVIGAVLAGTDSSDAQEAQAEAARKLQAEANKKRGMGNLGS